jgi:hypothetical protein
MTPKMTMAATVKSVRIARLGEMSGSIPTRRRSVRSNHAIHAKIATRNVKDQSPSGKSSNSIENRLILHAEQMRAPTARIAKVVCNRFWPVQASRAVR